MTIQRAISMLKGRPAAAPERRPDGLEVFWDVGRAPVCVVAPNRSGIRLRFHRSASDWGSDAVCFPDFGMLVSLAPFGSTPVDLGPRDSGAYRFYAPHGDLEGWLLVEP